MSCDNWQRNSMMRIISQISFFNDDRPHMRPFSSHLSRKYRFVPVLSLYNLSCVSRCRYPSTVLLFFALVFCLLFICTWVVEIGIFHVNVFIMMFSFYKIRLLLIDVAVIWQYCFLTFRFSLVLVPTWVVFTLDICHACLLHLRVLFSESMTCSLRLPLNDVVSFLAF